MANRIIAIAMAITDTAVIDALLTKTGAGTLALVGDGLLEFVGLGTLLPLVAGVDEGDGESLTTLIGLGTSPIVDVGDGEVAIGEGAADLEGEVTGGRVMFA